MGYGGESDLHIGRVRHPPVLDRVIRALEIRNRRSQRNPSVEPGRQRRQTVEGDHHLGHRAPYRMFRTA